jgi:hypothetical protein
MTKMEAWKEAKRNQDAAEKWASLLGKDSFATARHVGTISSARGDFTIHYQPSDGANNYHECSSAFRSALKDVMEAMAPELIRKAIEIMRETTRLALIQCEDELTSMQKEIADAKEVESA